MNDDLDVKMSIYRELSRNYGTCEGLNLRMDVFALLVLAGIPNMIEPNILIKTDDVIVEWRGRVDLEIIADSNACFWVRSNPSHYMPKYICIHCAHDMEWMRQTLQETHEHNGWIARGAANGETGRP